MRLQYNSIALIFHQYDHLQYFQTTVHLNNAYLTNNFFVQKQKCSTNAIQNILLYMQKLTNVREDHL